MAIIMTWMNGGLVSSSVNGYLNCDLNCEGCVADGRCKAQVDNGWNEMCLDEHADGWEHDNAFTISDAYPSGPEHCWGCEFSDCCTATQMKACLSGDDGEPDWDYKKADFQSPWFYFEDAMDYCFITIDIMNNPPF